MKFESKNPFLGNKAFAKTVTVYDADGNPIAVTGDDVMTVKGTINKSMLLFGILVASAILSVYLIIFAGMNPIVLGIGGGVAGFITVLVSGFKPELTRYMAPGYSVFKGLFVGAISLIMEMMYPGVVLQAVCGTLVTFAVCFLLYRFGVVKVNQQFRSVVIAATLAVFTYYIISLLLHWTIGFQPIHWGNSLMSIGISIFVIILAALNLFLDFDMIEKGASRGLPKYMEWFGAMGLMVTLVWLYVEFLRLFAKLSSRD